MTTAPFDIAELDAELRPGLQIVRLLGVGSAASVFLAREDVLQRHVAVKVLSPLMAQDGIVRQRFLREARSAARLAHPNITAVYRVGELASGIPYLVMQYVDGGTVADRIRAVGPFSVDEARGIMAEVAAALAAAHKEGIIHRDLRPGNVLYERETGRAVLTDFGLAAILDIAEARLTRPGERVGDPAHMSPEQLRGEPVTAASDVYALGLFAYEILGTPGPFGGSRLQAAMAHLTTQPRPLSTLHADIPADLSDLVVHCLAKEPEHRPSADDVVHTLRGRSPAEKSHAEDNDLLDALIKRRVAPITLAYVVAAWIILSFIDQLVDRGILPPATYGLSLGPFVGGLVAAGVLAWFHGASGRQEFRRLEIWLLVAAAIIGFAISGGVLILR